MLVTWLTAKSSKQNGVPNTRLSIRSPEKIGLRALFFQIETMIRKKLTFVLAVFIATVAMMALQKPVFLCYYHSLASEASGSELWAVVAHGLLHDMTLAGYITALPLLLSIASLWIDCSERIFRGIFKGYFVVISILTALIFAVDLGLYEHWGFRIDATILIYLADPKEAAASVDFATGALQSLMAVAWATGMILVYIRLSRLFDGQSVPWQRALLATMAGLLLTGFDFLAIRGGVGASTANVSKVYFSSNMFLNHAATNPVFSFLTSLSKRHDFSTDYAFTSDEECASRFDKIRGNRPESTTSESVLKTDRPNVVVVIMESFSRTLMDTDEAGEPLMPHLERYKNEGIWFENMIANSFRTDRGEVAILSGFPAQTTVSIMKLPGKSRNLPSIARSLNGVGYNNYFYYGGDLNFTDQASYMYATGWKNLIWQQDLSFDEPLSKWGYNDRVMAEFVTDEVLRLGEKGEPFLAGFLTLSSHPPFDVPYSKHSDPMFNAVAFTDEALGKMLDRWKASPLWDNLLVVLVADHGYPYPETLEYNEVLRHRIPMIWTGGVVANARTIDTYAAQIDIAATLLGQMGIDHSDFDYSKDIFAHDLQPKFGYYTFNNGFGVVDSEGEVIWDATSERIIRQTKPELLEIGQTMLQTTYRDLSKR